MKHARRLVIAVLAFVLAAEAHRPHVMGHRGCRALRSENTLAAFQHAVKLGVDVVEFDMVITANNRIIVNHDVTVNLDNCFLPDTSEPKGPLFIRLLTFEEIRQFDCGSRKNRNYPKQTPVPGARMPSLEEAFELLRNSSVDLMIETKMAAEGSPARVSPGHFVRVLHKAIARYGLQRRIILQSFDHRTLEEMRKLDPEVRLCMLNPAKRLPDYVKPALELGAAIQFINHRIIGPDDVAQLHAAGLKVFSGTTDDPKVWKMLVEYGVDGILTDDPAALIAFLSTGGNGDEQ